MKTKILKNSAIAPGYFRMVFESPFSGAKPGQFVMMRAGDGADPLLRRPMSIAGNRDGAAEVIYKVVGKGTALLAEKKDGDTLDIIGPFGNSFNPPPDVERTFLIGGGTGIAPLLFFAERNKECDMSVIIGGATKNDILMADEFRKYCSVVLITTEDGSEGREGVVTTPIDRFRWKIGEQIYVLSCGPPGMLKAVESYLTKFQIGGEMSLEERMGCGFGVCLGCMVDTRDGMKRVCNEGPVFKTGFVKWR